MAMELAESAERFHESLKKAASCARELAISQKYDVWNQIATSLDGLRMKGKRMTVARSIGKVELDKQIDEYKARAGEKADAKVQKEEGAKVIM